MQKLSPLLFGRLVGSRLWGSSPALGRRRQPPARYYIYLLRSSPAPHLLCGQTTLCQQHEGPIIGTSPHTSSSLVDIIKPLEVAGSQFSSWLLLSGWWLLVAGQGWVITCRERQVDWDRSRSQRSETGMKRWPGPGLQWAVSGGHWGQGSWCSEVAEQEPGYRPGPGVSGVRVSGVRGPETRTWHGLISSRPFLPLHLTKEKLQTLCAKIEFLEWDKIFECWQKSWQCFPPLLCWNLCYYPPVPGTVCSHHISPSLIPEDSIFLPALDDAASEPVPGIHPNKAPNVCSSSQHFCQHQHWYLLENLNANFHSNKQTYNAAKPHKIGFSFPHRKI